MYNSQYYTCEQIDQRLLQGYLDDYNTQTGQSLTKEQFLTKLGNIFAKETVIDNTAVNIGYFVCDTAAGTAAKAITASGYALFVGGSIKVKFLNRNTAGSATLNINSQGVKTLYYGGKPVSASNSWDNNEIVEIYYDGTSYYANNVEGNFKDGIFDISSYNLTEGQPTKYATLAEALGTNGANIPQSLRKGGMSVKFVQSSNNKYVQYRFKLQYENTAAGNILFGRAQNWVFVEENVLHNNSKYLGNNVFSAAESVLGKYISPSSITDFADSECKRLRVYEGEIITIIAAGLKNASDYNPVIAAGSDYTEQQVISTNGKLSTDGYMGLVVPSGCTYIYFNYCIRPADEENKSKFKLCYGKYEDFLHINNPSYSVKKAIFQNKLQIGRDIYNEGEIIDDYYLDTSGAPQAFTGAKYKIFEAIPNTQMTMLIDVIPQYGWGSVGAIGFYNVNGTKIGYVNTSTIVADNQRGYYTFTTPEKCYKIYVPLQIRETDSWIGKISLCYGSIDDLDNSAQKVSQNIQEAISHVLHWNNKTWLVFGDSLTEKNYRAETSYYDYIVSETGINIINKGLSSTGYKKPASEQYPNSPFYARIANAISSSIFDVMTIFGSINDILGTDYVIGTASDTGTETLGGCINTTLDNLFTAKPFAVVGLVTPTPCKDYMPYNNERMEQYCELIVSIAKRRSIPCLDLFHMSTLRPDDSNFRNEYYKENDILDTYGIHPNSKGHKRIYPMFREFLKTMLSCLSE